MGGWVGGVGYGDKTGMKWRKPALHLLRKPSLKRCKLCDAFKCIVRLRTCCANAAGPECVLCACARLPAMRILRLYLACHSLGAIVNFRGFWGQRVRRNKRAFQPVLACRLGVCLRGPTPQGGGGRGGGGAERLGDAEQC